MKKTTLGLALAAALTLPQSALLLAADSSLPGVPAAPQQGYLGIMIEPVPAVLRAQLPETVPRQQGVLVTEVMPDSPADRAGLQPFDILISFDNQKLFSAEQLSKLVAVNTGGNPVSVTLVRAGKKRTVPLDIGQQAPAGVTPYRHGPYHSHAARPWQNHHRHRYTRPMPPLQSRTENWESFDALSLEKLKDGRYKAVIEYLDAKDQHKKLEFTGSRDDIGRQIKAQEDMPAIEREQLLDALTSRDDWFPQPPFGPDAYLPPPWFWNPHF